jgi:peroxiredoxin
MKDAAPTIRTLRFAGVVLLVILGIWAGMRVGSIHARTGSNAATPGVRVPAGEASPPTESDAGSESDDVAGSLEHLPPTAIPERLPAFSLNDRDGKLTPISTWGGKSLILNFWATWCAPCRREIPLLKSLAGEWAAKNVQVVGIAVDFPDKVAKFADDLQIRYPLLIGEEEALDIAAKLGVASPVFPFTVFTDRRGEVVALYIGELHKPQADLILSVVKRLDDDQVALPEARRSIVTGLHALTAAPADARPS